LSAGAQALVQAFAASPLSVAQHWAQHGQSGQGSVQLPSLQHGQSGQGHSTQQALLAGWAPAEWLKAQAIEAAAASIPTTVIAR
jgi:hypothetical protein